MIRYDTFTDTWSTNFAKIEQPRGGYGKAVYDSVSNEIYCIGGEWPKKNIPEIGLNAQGINKQSDLTFI